jgi:hypothetical protein
MTTLVLAWSATANACGQSRACAPSTMLDDNDNFLAALHKLGTSWRAFLVTLVTLAISVALSGSLHEAGKRHLEALEDQGLDRLHETVNQRPAGDPAGAVIGRQVVPTPQIDAPGNLDGQEIDEASATARLR